MGINPLLSERKWGVIDPVCGYQLQQKHRSHARRGPRSNEGMRSSQACALS